MSDAALKVTARRVTMEIRAPAVQRMAVAAPAPVRLTVRPRIRLVMGVPKQGPPGPAGRDGADGRTLYAPRGPATVALIAGQPIAFVRIGLGVIPADAAVFALAHVIGLATADTPIGGTAIAERNSMTLADWTPAAGAPDLIPTRDYFLAAGGGLSLTPDTLPGHCTVRVGWAADARTLVIEPSSPFLN